MCLALRASGLWLRYATLQNLIPSFPWIAPPHPPPLAQSKERKGSNFAIWQPCVQPRLRVRARGQGEHALSLRQRGRHDQLGPGARGVQVVGRGKCELQWFLYPGSGFLSLSAIPDTYPRKCGIILPCEAGCIRMHIVENPSFQLRSRR